MATKQADNDETPSYPDVISDFERGCGSLDHGSTYLTADVSLFGTLPAFVEFDTPVPYREGHFRTFKRINGTEFLLEATQGGQALTAEVPEDEILAHVSRAQDDVPTSEQAGGLKSMDAQDLLMHVGKSYYPRPEDFVSEARTQGVNKKIPASENQEPPRVNPGHTRLFLIHPRAIPTGKNEDGDVIEIDDEDEDKADYDDQVFIPGIIGYSYLTRIIHTADVDGEQPEWVQEMGDKRDDFDPVEIGEFIPDDDPAHPEYDESDEDAASDDASEDEGDTTSDDADDADEPVSASDADGPFADRVWSDEAETFINELLDDEATPEAFAKELKSMNAQTMRSLTSKLDLGTALGSNPTKDEMSAMLGRVPVFQGPVGDDTYYADVDGVAYPLDELEARRESDERDEKLPAVHAKMAALKDEENA